MAKIKDTQEMFSSMINETDVSNSDLFKSQKNIITIEPLDQKKDKAIFDYLNNTNGYKPFGIIHFIVPSPSLKFSNFKNKDKINKNGYYIAVGDNLYSKEDLISLMVEWAINNEDYDYHYNIFKKIGLEKEFDNLYNKKINLSYKQKNDGLKDGLIKQTILSFPYSQYFEGHPNADQIATEYLKYIQAIKQDKFAPNVLEAIQNDLKSVFDNRTYGQDKNKDYDLLKIGLKVLSKYQRLIV